jgi:hypothetical protein
MSRPIKFRYANEIAGAFVIIALGLFVGGVFLAGRSQGWFEGKFELMADFATAEGSFGLREGGEVWVMNTVAGRVAKIEPTGDGRMQGRLIIQNRYRPFIRTDSVARVKKKFGVAGDAYVDIEVGKGPEVVDGSVIPCIKDEELMEIARKTLEDLQEDVLPMIEDSKEILSHVNTISAAIASGEGLAGAAVNDPAMTAEVKEMLEGVNALVVASEDALHETTRLIKGAQKHWLIRKYVGDADPEVVLSTSQIERGARDRLVRAWTQGAAAGRLSNTPRQVALNALNLGYAALLGGRYDEAAGWLAEARFEMAAAGMSPVRGLLLAAEVARRRGDPGGALAILGDEEPRGEVTRAERAAWHLQVARARLAAGEADAAGEALARAERHARKAKLDVLAAEAAEVHGELALAADRTAEAARRFDRAAGLFRDAGLYTAMCRALARAGRIYEQDGEADVAFDRYYRAARSRVVGGEKGADALASARRIAVAMGDPERRAQVDRVGAATGE